MNLKDHQLSLELFSGSELKEKGIELAIDHAERITPNWKETAYEMFKEWLSGWPPRLQVFNGRCKGTFRDKGIAGSAITQGLW